MKNLDQVTKLFADPTSTKTITTTSADGTLHTIVAGSIFPADNDTIGVAEIIMNTTAANLASNDKAAFLAVNGMESYLINATVQKRHTDGAIYDNMAQMLAKNNMTPKAVWTFTVDKIFNQSPTPDAGKQLF